MRVVTGTENRWGGARARTGATDTTMLVWKVIDASPGIIGEEIFTKVEHQIPAGYAKRRHRKRNPHAKYVDDADATYWARRFVLFEDLRNMRRYGSVSKDGDGYRVLREIKQYRGDPSVVDETGTAAAEHLNAAYALKVLDAVLARNEGQRLKRYTTEEHEALKTCRDALRRRMRE